MCYTRQNNRDQKAFSLLRVSCSKTLIGRERFLVSVVLPGVVRSALVKVFSTMCSKDFRHFVYVVCYIKTLHLQTLCCVVSPPSIYYSTSTRLGKALSTDPGQLRCGGCVPSNRARLPGLAEHHHRRAIPALGLGQAEQRVGHCAGGCRWRLAHVRTVHDGCGPSHSGTASLLLHVQC